MPAASSSEIAYVGYLVWLVFGMADFILHRRSDLPHTSGVPESSLHGLQIGVVGGGVLLWAALENSWTLAVLLLILAVVHALFGYRDTVVADETRRIVPLEQHVHSVLDLAPWAFVAWTAWSAEPTWEIAWAPQPAFIWAALMIPTIPTVLLPWMLEIRASWREWSQST